VDKKCSKEVRGQSVLPVSFKKDFLQNLEREALRDRLDLFFPMLRFSLSIHEVYQRLD
jgi:hypothetical protein